MTIAQATAEAIPSSWYWPSYAAAGDVSPRHVGLSFGPCSNVQAIAQHRELAEDVGKRVRAHGLDVHMSTIYRFLDELEELGVVSHSHLGHGRAVYDLSPVGHSHLVCELCGAVTETPNELFAAFASSVKARYGFSIDPTISPWPDDAGTAWSEPLIGAGQRALRARPVSSGGDRNPAAGPLDHVGGNSGGLFVPAYSGTALSYSPSNSGDVIRKSAVARLHATGIFQTTLLRRSAFTSGS